MAQDAIQHVEEMYAWRIKQDWPRRQPRRSKSYDTMLSDSEPGTTRQQSRTRLLQRKSSSYVESRSDTTPGEEIVLGLSNLDGQPNSDNGTGRKDPVPALSDGVNGDVFENIFEDLDRREALADQGWSVQSLTEVVDRIATEPSSPRTVQKSISPLASEEALADDRQSEFVLDENQTEVLRQHSPDLVPDERETEKIEQFPVPTLPLGSATFATEHEFAPLSKQFQQDIQQDAPMQVDGYDTSQTMPTAEPPAVDSLPGPPESTRPEDSAEFFGKQVRRLRKKTDDVLLKRMQYRTEHQKLESCQEYLRESTTKLMSAMKIPQPTEPLNSSPRTRRRPRRRKRTRDEIRPDFSLSDYGGSSGQDNSDVSGTDVSPEVVESLESGTTSDPFSTLESSHPQEPDLGPLFERYFEDFKQLKLQEEVEKRSMEHLSDREFHLMNLLETIKTAMHSPDFVNNLRAEMLEGSIPSSVHSRDTPPQEEELDPLLVEYFDLQGNIGIFLERLQELDYEHGEGVLEREFVRERGDELELSDEGFESNYEDQRVQIEQDLNKARLQFTIIAERCKLANLDPELYRNTGYSERSKSPVPSGHRVSTGVAILERKREQRRPLSPTRKGSSSLQIEGWLRDVLGSDPSDPLLLESL